MPVRFQDVQSAAKRIAGGIIESPCPASIPLSEATGMTVFCKLEYLQRTGSFKERGAGNVAGMALALKTIKPEVKVIGVEPEHAASFTAAVSAGHPVEIELKPTLADGLSVPKVGENAFAIARDLVERTVLVGEPDLA